MSTNNTTPPAAQPSLHAGRNQMLEPDHREMLTRLGRLTQTAALHSLVSVDEVELRQLLALAEDGLVAPLHPSAAPAAQPCPPMDAMSDEQLIVELCAQQALFTNEKGPTRHLRPRLDALKGEVLRRLLAARPVAVSEETIEKAWDAAFYDWCNETGDKSSRERAIETLSKHFAATPSAPTNPAPISTKLVDAEVTPSAQGGEAEEAHERTVWRLRLAERHHEAAEADVASLSAQLESVTKERDGLCTALDRIIKEHDNYFESAPPMDGPDSLDEAILAAKAIPTTNGAEGAR